MELGHLAWPVSWGRRCGGTLGTGPDCCRAHGDHHVSRRRGDREHPDGHPGGWSSLVYALAGTSGHTTPSGHTSPTSTDPSAASWRLTRRPVASSTPRASTHPTRRAAACRTCCRSGPATTRSRSWPPPRTVPALEIAVNINVDGPAANCDPAFVPETRRCSTTLRATPAKQYQMLRHLVNMINCMPAAQ